MDLKVISLDLKGIELDLIWIHFGLNWIKIGAARAHSIPITWSPTDGGIFLGIDGMMKWDRMKCRNIEKYVLI